MSTSYHRQNQIIMDGGPGWTLLMITLIIAFCLIGLPAIALGYLAQQGTSRWIINWRIRFLFWLLLGLISALWLYYQNTMIMPIILRALMDDVMTLKRYQLHFALWNRAQLWNEIWAAWLHTIAAFPLVGFWQEISNETVRTDVQSEFKQQQRRRRRQNARSQRQAVKRTHRPHRIPDALGGEMVIGVPIQEQEDIE